MAEQISGSEEEFVGQMNARAAELGMTNTHFVDCCGLTDAKEHYTSARDVALMSRELLKRFPQVVEYSDIWMEDITHVTAKGSSRFTLTNTNKLLRSYDGCDGLKTGSTSFAKILSERNGEKGWNSTDQRCDDFTGFEDAVCGGGEASELRIFALLLVLR